CRSSGGVGPSVRDAKGIGLRDPSSSSRFSQPSLVPMLWRYRQVVGRPGETRLSRLTALVGVGHFVVWTAIVHSRPPDGRTGGGTAKISTWSRAGLFVACPPLSAATTLSCASRS